MDCNKRSNIKLKSNIITKDKWMKDGNRYLPFELLPEEYHDPALWLKLTSEQSSRYEEVLFHCKRKREVKDRIWQTSKCYENCKECHYQNICY